MRSCFVAATLFALASTTWAATEPGKTPTAAPARITSWRAGLARVKITPDESMWMAGYAARKKPSEGVLQDIYAKALALEDSQQARLVIVTLDLIGVPRALRDNLQKEAQERFHLPPAALLLNASHTHSGPEFRVSSTAATATTDRARQAVAYSEKLQSQILGIVGEALQKLEPAQLDYLHARCGFAMNRRRPTERGFANAPNIDGPVDHDVPVLRVSAADGTLRAVLFGYACHNTTLGFYKICGDYAGFAQHYLEADHPDVTAMFMAGCGGDQNPYPRSTEDRAQYHGRTLAVAVEAALETVPRPIPGPLTSHLEEVTLDFVAPPPLEELEKIAAGKKEPDAGHAKRLLAQSKQPGGIRKTYPYLVQVVRFGGDLTMVALAGEVVVDYSLRLKRELAGPAVWIAGYSNDVFGYVPSKRVLQEGGYEAGEASRYGSLPAGFAPTIEERIVGKAVELARRPLDTLPRSVDLKLGQQTQVVLPNGRTVNVKLLALSEQRDTLRNAIRRADVQVEIDGQKLTLPSATYHLPQTAGNAQIDCPITKGYLEWGDKWGFKADARLRLWPAGAPWITPGTFDYPAKQRWFASATQMANEIADGDDVTKKAIYYHWGLDIGGADQLVPVVAATDAEVVALGDKTVGDAKALPAPVKPRYDVIYLRDARDWYYRYSHLDAFDPAVELGGRVKIGQRIGTLGKEGASGGWSHLHFDIVAPQPSGEWGILEGYAFLWQAYHAQAETKVQAVARLRLLAEVGQPIKLDGRRSWSYKGAAHLTKFQWTFTDGSQAEGPVVERAYGAPGQYCEMLQVTDAEGNTDFDFTLVRVVDKNELDRQPPRIHAAYWPTTGIKPNNEVQFLVRSFAIAPDDGQEEWDFGDGSSKVCVRSDANVDPHAKAGYAVTKHRYAKPGRYFVSVQRTDRHGHTAVDRLMVLVEAGKKK